MITSTPSISPAVPTSSTSNEAERLATLHTLQILGTPPEERFDRITRLAQKLFRVPIALISLSDTNRQWFKSCQGWAIREVPQAQSFCTHNSSQNEIMIVEDTHLDARFVDSPFVTDEPHLRFYAGQPLHHPNGSHLGTLCILDLMPRKLDAEEQQSLQDLAHLAENELVATELAQVIAAHNQAENQLYFQAHLLENVQEAVIATDPKGQIIFWNNFAQTLYGWQREEVEGRNILDILLPAQSVREQIEQMIADQAHSTEPVLGEYQLRHRNGNVLQVQSTSTSVYDHEGQLIAIVASSRDITERKEAEQKLVESEQRFRALIEHSADMITLIGATGEVLYQSPSVARVMGYSQEEWASGKSSFEEVHPDDLPILLENFQKLKQNPQEVHSVEFRFRHKGDGTWHYVEAISHNLLAQSAIKAVVVNARDVTSRRLAEERVRQQEEQLRQTYRMEAVGRLTGGIAHDFNNLMTAILGYTELLLLQHPESAAPSQTHNYNRNTWESLLPVTEKDLERADLLEIKRTAERATTLTRQLLAFSRKQVLRPETLDIGKVVANLSKMLQRLIREDISLRTEVAPGLAMVEADPSQIDQIIINLVVNARDAIKGEGQVRIEVFNEELDARKVKRYTYSVQPGSYVCLSVKDNGAGMNQETLSHIFEPFYTTKDISEGTGLGLATVYGIVKQSQGYIWVESEVGIGTTFKVYLPQLNPRPDAPSSSAADDKDGQAGEENTSEIGDSAYRLNQVSSTFQETPGNSLAAATVAPNVQNTVLLVEDEISISQVLARSLSDQKLKVLTAANGAEALALAQDYEGKIDLILTDVMLPGMRGPEVIKSLRQLYPNVRAIIMSGYSEEAIAEQGSLLEGTVFLEKPFDLATLITLVWKTLGTQETQPAT